MGKRIQITREQQFHASPALCSYSLDAHPSCHVWFHLITKLMKLQDNTIIRALFALCRGEKQLVRKTHMIGNDEIFF